MPRILNSVCQINDAFYRDDRTICTLFGAVIEELRLPEDCRFVTYPRGHFHYSPLIIGGIVSQNFHLAFHLSTEIQKAIIDIYHADVRKYSITISRIIGKHCQPVFFETLPEHYGVDFSSGEYVNFHADYLKFCDLVDRLAILGNYLELGRAYVTPFIPPHEDNDKSYDILRIYSGGYFAIHTTGDFLDIDILLDRKMSKADIESWFQGCSDIHFLPRTICQESLY